MTDTQTVLSSLLPVAHNSVMDLVDASGISTSPWKTKKNGKPVRTPRANPNFCYEWAFGGGLEPIALCIWHKDLVIVEDQICCEDNLLEFALRLEAKSHETSDKKVKFRAQSQAKRARKFDLLIKEAFANDVPLRVILLRGKDGDVNNPGFDAAVVKFRILDQVTWHVASYRQDGNFKIIRGTKETRKPGYFDQFSLGEPAQRIATTSTAFLRSRDVREAVLLRAGGVCEHCGQPGFLMANGGVYLETHHVVPLSEDGADHPSNVVAICANDHRMAHHAAEREEMREQLLSKLASLQ